MSVVPAMDEKHVDIDEPWTQLYVHIAQTPSDETKATCSVQLTRGVFS